MFEKKPTEYKIARNIVFEDGGKYWFPFEQIPVIGTTLIIKEDAIEYDIHKRQGKYTVTNVEYSYEDQYCHKRSNFIFIYVKRQNDEGVN